MNVFLTSDTHFGHANIIKYCHRPFSSVEEMDETLVERWNAIVRPQDHVYHLGDVAMQPKALQIVKRLNGHKRLVLGNHDGWDMRAYAEVGFKKVFGSRRMDGLLLTHIPLHQGSVWDAAERRDSKVLGNVHGHIHDRDSPMGPYLNVCVEKMDYTPVEFGQVRDAMLKRLELLELVAK
jgi:calcineurin-like phosphoesterase family protein